MFKQDEIDQAVNDLLEKGGKKAVIGEIRTFAGRKHIKTAEGWKFYGEGKGKKAQAHESAHKTQKVSETAQKPAEKHPGYTNNYGNKFTFDKNNQLHSYNNEPAYISRDGDRKWYQNGKPHREGGPALELANGTKMWYQNGRLHREDGPAIQELYRKPQYFLNNEEVSINEFKPHIINHLSKKYNLPKTQIHSDNTLLSPAHRDELRKLGVESAEEKPSRGERQTSKKNKRDDKSTVSELFAKYKIEDFRGYNKQGKRSQVFDYAKSQLLSENDALVNVLRNLPLLDKNKYSVEVEQENYHSKPERYEIQSEREWQEIKGTTIRITIKDLERNKKYDIASGDYYEDGPQKKGTMRGYVKAFYDTPSDLKQLLGIA